METRTTEFKWPPRQAIVAAKTFDDVWGVRNPIKGRSVEECLGDIDKYTPKTTETEENATAKRKFKTKHVSGFTRRLKKTAAEFGDKLSEGEVWHIKKRHERHLDTWHKNNWNMEDQTTDCVFIQSVRLYQCPAEEVSVNKVRRNKYKRINGINVKHLIPELEPKRQPRRKRNISKEERLEANKLIYRRVEQLATKDPNEDAELWANIEAAGSAADCFTLRKNGSRRSKAGIINAIKHSLLKTRRWFRN